MPEITLPNGWQPRAYQRKLWRYLEHGGKRAAVCWHRRAGKDDVGLNRAAVAAFERPANYWHMLPEYRQSRKAIWEAVDPHTGKKRIDQAFPPELRARTNDNEMFVEFVNGATWRVVGSDSFDSLVGAGPAGIVFSEWALSNPRAWGVLAPMLEENGGWALFIYTARGRNHGYSTVKLAQNTPGWFGEVLPATDTDVFSAEQLARIRAEYIALDSQNGEALYEQEYECNFDAAVHGAYWAKELAKAERDGRICDVAWDPSQPVHTVWDIGIRDATAIWFFQPLFGGLHVIDYYEASGVGLDHYAEVLKERPYTYGWAYVPHDGIAREWGSGKTRVEQMIAHKFKPHPVPNNSLIDGIHAGRLTLPLAKFDREKCKRGLEALVHYHAEYDEDRKVLKPTPEHDWSSHAADAWRYLSLAWRESMKDAPPKPPPRFWDDKPTMDELWAAHGKQHAGRTRI